MFPTLHFREQLLRFVSDENDVLVKGNKLRPDYKCILFAEQKREVLSENRKLEYYVLGEQFLSSLQLMDQTKSEQFVSCDDSLTLTDKVSISESCSTCSRLFCSAIVQLSVCLLHCINRMAEMYVRNNQRCLNPSC